MALSAYRAALRSRASLGVAGRRHLSSHYSNILVKAEGASSDVALITLNRPKHLNALNSELFKELNAALAEIDQDNSIGAVVITGSKRAFAAGADIKEMKDKTYDDVYQEKFLSTWQDVRNIKKPIIAAVSGYAVRLLVLCATLVKSSA
jgi:enoyl-CoA hydratase